MNNPHRIRFFPGIIYINLGNNFFNWCLQIDFAFLKKFEESQSHKAFCNRACSKYGVSVNRCFCFHVCITNSIQINNRIFCNDCNASTWDSILDKQAVYAEFQFLDGLWVILFWYSILL